MGSGYANCCQVCDGRQPKWTVRREGDAVVSWACDAHLVTVLNDLQLDYGVTILSVHLTAEMARVVRESREQVAEVNREIREAMPGPGS